MAGFSYNGVDRLEADYTKLAQLSDEDKWKVLSAGADVIKAFHEKTISNLFKKRTGQLLGSIQIAKKLSSGELVAVIAPSGKRKKTSTGKRRYKGKSSGSYQGTNTEVAFILEYGSPRIRATHWMESANEASGEELENAMAQVWDQRLKEINL